jgi:hypothetical protein
MLDLLLHYECTRTRENRAGALESSVCVIHGSDTIPVVFISVHSHRILTVRHFGKREIGDANSRGEINALLSYDTKSDQKTAKEYGWAKELGKQEHGK